MRVSYSGSTKVSKAFSGGPIPSTRALTAVSNPAAAGRFPQPLLNRNLTNSLESVCN